MTDQTHAGELTHPIGSSLRRTYRSPNKVTLPEFGLLDFRHRPMVVVVSHSAALDKEIKCNHAAPGSRLVPENHSPRGDSNMGWTWMHKHGAGRPMI